MKTTFITVRLSEQEKQKIDLLAQKQNMKSSEYIRDIVLNDDQILLEECLKILKSVQENQKNMHKKIDTTYTEFRKFMQQAFFVNKYIFQMKYLVTTSINTLLKNFRTNLKNQDDIPNNQHIQQFVDECYALMEEKGSEIQ